ncbi:hypothetical protein Abr02nite_74910 [Paractinoplanes brasiliensis]|nr:hypothetical protein Abr02nite_74910 [Actinoplanes brasiliensis]
MTAKSGRHHRRRLRSGADSPSDITRRPTRNDCTAGGTYGAAGVLRAGTRKTGPKPNHSTGGRTPGWDTGYGVAGVARSTSRARARRVVAKPSRPATESSGAA